MHINWNWIVLIIYLAILIVVCLRIVFETHSSTKTIAYLLFCIFVPVCGLLFDRAFGINYWKKKLYTRKQNEDDKILQQLKKNIHRFNDVIVNPDDISKDDNAELVAMLLKDLHSPLTCGNSVKVLLNGEEKFPELMECLKKAKHHIHIEYYIYVQDDIGTAII